MSDFIIECSLTMAWCFESEQTAHTQGLLARLSMEEACVPSLWPLEVANVLLVAERRKRITSVQSAQFVSVLRSLPITVEPHDTAKVWDAVLPLARSQSLSSYDAAYLELALRTGLPLATLDADLHKAAAGLGITLL